MIKRQYPALLAIAALASCTGQTDGATTTSSREPVTTSTSVRARTEVLTSDGSPLQMLAGASQDSPEWFVAIQVVPGEPYWTGLSTITVVGDDPVDIVGAQLAGPDGLQLEGVFIGEDDIDGIPGTTPLVAPGNELPGEPRLAVGARLEPGQAIIVYSVVTIIDGGSTGSLLGAELTIETASGEQTTVHVPSPTVLCTAEEVGEPDCIEHEEAFVDRLYEFLGVE